MKKKRRTRVEGKKKAVWVRTVVVQVVTAVAAEAEVDGQLATVVGGVRLKGERLLGGNINQHR